MTDTATPGEPIDLQSWVGREERQSDLLSARQARLMETTLDRDASLRDGDVLPPFWPWIYFHAAPPVSRLGRDGHAARGGFLPPVPLPRRMWAAGSLRVQAPLRIGEEATRLSRIASVTEKSGRSGPLCFVEAEHSYLVGREVRIVETQTLVFREDPAPGAPQPPPAEPPRGAERENLVTPSPVQLFRYSALTFNGHRIHYDRDYCRDVEGYPGLIFHGPLTATLLAGLAEEIAGRPLAHFSFRAVAPLFDLAPFPLKAKRQEGGRLLLWAETPEGHLAMRAEAEF